MPFLDYNHMPQLKLMQGIHGAFFHSERLTFGHITLEEGAILPEHKHVHEQWTHVIEGQLSFTLAGETRVLSPGESVYIPSDTLHSAVALTRCKAIDAFLPTREDFKTLEPWTES